MSKVSGVRSQPPPQQTSVRRSPPPKKKTAPRKAPPPPPKRSSGTVNKKAWTFALLKHKFLNNIFII